MDDFIFRMSARGLEKHFSVAIVRGNFSGQLSQPGGGTKFLPVYVPKILLNLPPWRSVLFILRIWTGSRRERY